MAISLPPRSRRWSYRTGGLLCAGLVCLAGAAHSAANAPEKTDTTAKGDKAAPVTNAAPAVIVIPKAVFMDDPNSGRDPFYPDSRRRKPAVEAPPKNAGGTHVASTPQQPVVRKDPFAGLMLRGLSGPVGRRIVTINNVTFSQGETAFVKTPDGSVRVTVVEIRGSTAVITIEGQTERRELKLPGEI